MLVNILQPFSIQILKFQESNDKERKHFPISIFILSLLPMDSRCASNDCVFYMTISISSS